MFAWSAYYILTAVLLYCCDRRPTKINIGKRRPVTGAKNGEAVGSGVDLAAVVRADRAAAAAAAIAIVMLAVLAVVARIDLVVGILANIVDSHALAVTVAADDRNVRSTIDTVAIAVAVMVVVMMLVLKIMTVTTGLQRKRNQRRQ